MANISMNEAEILSSVDNINLLAFDENNIYKFPLSQDIQELLFTNKLLIGKYTDNGGVIIGNGNNQATVENAAAAGIGTIANTAGQFVVGKYNAATDGALFIVGKGTSSSSPRNAFYIDKDGKGIFTSDIKINGSLSLNDTIYTLNQKSHQVFVQSSQPSGGEVGDIWCKPI